jgi:hypothetical protein
VRVHFGLDPQKESADLRERARRLRYIAEGLSQAADKARVNQYADELEKRAAEVEQEAARPTGPTVIVPAPVTHTQQQVQQQQGTEPKLEPPLSKT